MRILRGRPLLQSAAVNSALFIAMMVLFRPYPENPADLAFSGGAWRLCMWVLGAAALTGTGFMAFECGRSLAGRILITGVLIYLSFECYILPDTVKLFVILLCSALFAGGCAFSFSGRTNFVIITVSLAVCAAALAVFLINRSISGVYSVEATMPVMEPFRFGELRYHSILSALKDYLKYEPRIILQVPLLYPVLFLAYMVSFYGGNKGRKAAAFSMVLWMALTFAGRMFSLLGYYWVYSAAFIPSLFLLMFFVKDTELPDARRAYVHIVLLALLPVVVLPARFAGVWRFETGYDKSPEAVYLYGVNPYELEKE